MSAARDQIFGTIRQSLGRGAHGAVATAALEKRLTAHAANLIPGRAQIGHDDQVSLFTEEAITVSATVERVAAPGDVPRAVAGYLAAHNLPTRLKVAPDATLKDIPWTEQTALGVTFGPADDQDMVGVSRAFSAVAETGTLVLTSAPTTPTTLNYLPDTHIVVVAAASIVGTYEDVWTRLRAVAGPGGATMPQSMPRVVNWITGPSRTGDIELTLLLGAHGPRRLHIVIVDDETA